MSYITEQRARYVKEQKSTHEEQAKMEIPDRKEVTWTPASQKYEPCNKKMQSPVGGKIVSGNK